MACINEQLHKTFWKKKKKQRSWKETHGNSTNMKTKSSLITEGYHLYQCSEYMSDLSSFVELVPSNNNAGVLDHAQVFHPIFGQKLLSMVTDQNHLVGVFHQQSVVTGHSWVDTHALLSGRNRIEWTSQIFEQESLKCTKGAGQQNCGQNLTRHKPKQCIQKFVYKAAKAHDESTYSCQNPLSIKMHTHL